MEDHGLEYQLEQILLRVEAWVFPVVPTWRTGWSMACSIAILHPVRGIGYCTTRTAFGRCAKFHTMRISWQKAVDWEVLGEIGERERAKRWIGEETPWRRLFEMAFQLSYMEVVVKFLSTFTYRPSGMPEIVFSMLRQ
ncbi:hypothetical protein R6Q57_008827 [Mikania cordata]